MTIVELDVDVAGVETDEIKYRRTINLYLFETPVADTRHLFDTTSASIR